MVTFVRYKIDMNKTEMGEVKQSWMFFLEERKNAAQPHDIGLNFFPDMFEDSGFVINEDVFHSLSPCLLYCHVVISGYLNNK